MNETTDAIAKEASRYFARKHRKEGRAYDLAYETRGAEILGALAVIEGRIRLGQIGVMRREVGRWSKRPCTSQPWRKPMSQPLFSPRHFEWLAEFIRSNYSHRLPAYISKTDAIMDLAYALAETNPNFNREKFLKACGYAGE